MGTDRRRFDERLNPDSDDRKTTAHHRNKQEICLPYINRVTDNNQIKYIMPIILISYAIYTLCVTLN